MIDIYGSFMQNPSRTNKMADKSKTRLFDLCNAILIKSLKITQSKRAQQNLPQRCERRGIITNKLNSGRRVSVKPGTARNTPEHPGTPPEHPGTPRNTPGTSRNTPEHQNFFNTDNKKCKIN